MKITIELDTDILTPEQLTAVGMLIPSPFAVKREEKPKTIKRADVRLRVGDFCVNGSGEKLLVIDDDAADRWGGNYPVRMDVDRHFTPDGRCYHDTQGPWDVVSVNGVKIED